MQALEAEAADPEAAVETDAEADKKDRETAKIIADTSTAALEEQSREGIPFKEGYFLPEDETGDAATGRAGDDDDDVVSGDDSSDMEDAEAGREEEDEIEADLSSDEKVADARKRKVRDLGLPDTLVGLALASP